MFVGHFALGFAAKRVTPSISLAMLFVAAQLADLMWPALVALGVEQVRIEPGITKLTPFDFISYPYSHSLLLLAIWGIVLGLTYRNPARDRQAFIVLAGLVVSHWVLDVVTHRPDMPLYPGGPRLGLGLWNSVPATLAVELTLYAAGVWIYARSTRARDGTGRWAFIGLSVLLLVVYLGSLGSVPPSVQAVSIAGILGGALTIALAWWADAHRGAGLPGR